MAATVGYCMIMSHCTTNACIMNGVDTMEEAERSPRHFCPLCQSKLITVVPRDPAARCLALAQATRALGLVDDAVELEADAARLNAA